MSIYDTLNREQREACFHTEGPVLILAGAGSGKTRVITHRIAYLMEECGVNPWNILAITFTNKAAGEMRERVDKLIGFGSESVWISTFHSMCVRILRRHIDQIGFSSNFNIYDSDDQKTLVKQIMRRMNIDDQLLSFRSVIHAISSAKSELQTPQQFRDTHTGSYQEEKTGEIYQEYQRQLRANNALDFDDLLMKTVELFNAHGEILKNYQERFRYIMVDEYQDTNRAQFEIVRRLAAGHRNLCVVGDDDQSIYKFRGADIRNILDFEKVYRDAFVVRLEQNYRSTQNILDAANAVIANNENRKSKRLWTDRGSGTKIHFHEFPDGRGEAAFIADDIDRCIRKDPKLSYKDFAVLYRTNAQSRLIEDEFVHQSIPYNIVGGHNFYDRMEVRDILGYLRTINNAQDDISTQRIINVPKRGIGRTTIERIDAAAQKEQVSFFDICQKMDRIPDLARARSKVLPFVRLILECRDYAENHSVSDLIRKVIEDTGYEDYLQDYDEETAEDRIQNVDELISKAVSYEEESEESADSDGPSLADFLENVSLVADIDQVGDSDDRVLLMTLHSAKGLEFPHVYMAGMEENIFPSFQSVLASGSGNGEPMEEERRLAYVGITRAREELTLTAAHSRMIRGNLQFNSVSRFVYEIPEELLDESAEQDPAPVGASAGTKGRFTDYDSDSHESGMPWSRSSGSACGRNNPYRSPADPVRSRPARPAARYVPPHTAAEKKPYLSASTGLDTLKKGMPAGTKPDYEPGDRVHHVKYGVGTVESVEKGPKDYKVKVNFDEAGPKIMYAAFAKLKKEE